MTVRREAGGGGRRLFSSVTFPIQTLNINRVEVSKVSILNTGSTRGVLLWPGTS